MRKDIFKKIGLISKSGFLASSLINIEAMESVENKIINKSEINNESEIITLKQYLKLKSEEDLSSLNKDNTYKIIDKLYNELDSKDDSYYKIIDKEHFLELINKKNKEDILYPIRFGDEARKNAYDLSKKMREYIYKKEEELGINKKPGFYASDLNFYYQKLARYFIDEKKDINPKTTGLGITYDPIIKRFKNENINNEIFKINENFDCSKLGLIDPQNFNNDHIKNIGRNVLNCITKDIYKNLNGEDKASSELKRLFNGEMNCTCNAFMLYTFLRLNKILCYTYTMHCHEFVLIPLKNEENKAINFYQVDLYEKETINDMSFGIKDIIEISKDDNIWFGMIKSYKKRETYKYFMFNNGFTPTYIYYKNLRDFIDDIIRKFEKEKYKIKKKDIKLIKYYLNGLKNAWQYINEKYKDKDDIYSVKFLPIEKGKCLFLPNVLDLGEPKFVKAYDEKFSYNKIMFKSLKNPKKYVNLKYAYIDIPKKYKKNIENIKLKITKTTFEFQYIEYSILYKDKEKENFIKNEKSNIENNECGMDF